MPRAAAPLAVLLLAGAGTIAFAALAMAQGDGSATDNPDLLRGPVGVGCRPGTLCHFPPIDPNAPQRPVAPIVIAQPAVPPTPAPAIMPAVSPTATDSFVASPPMGVPFAEPSREWDTEYALSLRGAYVRSDAGERFELLAIPEIALSREALATDIGIGASATVIAPNTSDARLGAADIGASVTHRLSPGAALNFDASLEFTEDDPSGLTVEDVDVDSAPQTIDGAVSLAYGQRLGQFDLVASGDLSRRWVGDTTLGDGSRVDNSDDDVFGYGAGLRVGYAVTPIIGTFVSGRAGREDYSNPDADLGVSRSGADYTLRGGITGNWSDVVTLEASVGSGWRDFDNSALEDAQSWLYGAAIGFAPNSTTQLVASLDTRLSGGSGTSGASTSYDAALEATHRINPWLALRANVSAGWDVPVDGSATTRTSGLGTGADIAIGPHTSATLDYGYGWREDPNAVDPSREEHRISGGITLGY